MRILFISNFYPPYEIGGLEQMCKQVVDALRTQGHACHVLTSRYGTNAQAPPEEGVSRELHLDADVYHYRPLDFFLRHPAHMRDNRRALNRALEEFEPDVVFVWGMWILSSQIASWAEEQMPGRVAYYVAGYWMIESDAHESYWQAPANRRWVEWLKAPARRWALQVLAREKATYSLAREHVACVSDYVRRKLAEAGALPKGARIIYNGIEPDRFIGATSSQPASQDAMRLVYTGILARHKGVHTAVESLGLLKQRGEAQGVHLSLVGSGHPDYKAYLSRRVHELDLEEHVTFYGRVPREEIAGILANHDAFLFTSIYEEPIARSVMEAMAAGLTVIGTPVGGQREMLRDEENALVFAPDQAGDLAECIQRLRQDSTLHARLAAAGRETVLKQFTIERMTDEMEAWLTEIVA